jgi:hypothetical protein
MFLGNSTPTTRLHGVIKWKVTMFSRSISLFAELHRATGFFMHSGAIELVRSDGQRDV